MGLNCCWYAPVMLQYRAVLLKPTNRKPQVRCKQRHLARRCGNADVGSESTARMQAAQDDIPQQARPQSALTQCHQPHRLPIARSCQQDPWHATQQPEGQ